LEENSGRDKKYVIRNNKIIRKRIKKATSESKNRKEHVID